VHGMDVAIRFWGSVSAICSSRYISSLKPPEFWLAPWRASVSSG
jgi:hypothetical protein